MKRKNILLGLISILSLVSCNYLNNNEENKDTNDSVSNVANTTKDKYTLTWKVENETKVENNVLRGKYPEYGKVPTKENTNDHKMYKFTGWSKVGNTNALLEEDLPPVLSDTTYQAKFEEVDSCKVTIKMNVRDGALLSVDPSTESYPVWKEIDVEANTKLELDTSLIPIPTSSNSEKFFSIMNYTDYSKMSDNIGSYIYSKVSDIPAITSDTTLVVNFKEETKKYNVSFYNQDKLYKIDVFNGVMQIPSGENINIGNTSSGKIGIYKQPDPVKIVNGKKYAFVGWNKNKNATTGTATSSLSEVITSDTSYYAIFSSTGSDVSFSYYGNSSTNALTFSQATASNSAYTLSSGKLSFNTSKYPSSSAKQVDIYLPDNSNITSLSDNFLSNYSSLNSIRLPNTLTSLPENAFKNCTGLQVVDLSACTNLTSIPNGCFQSCSSLEVVRGFEKIKTVGNNAFDGCSSLPLPDLSNVTSVGERGFRKTRGDSNYKVTIPSSLTSIGSESFSEGSFKELEIKEGITSLSKLAFAYNEDLTRITIPSSVSQIQYDNGTSTNNNAFTGSDNINTVSINANNSSYYSYATSIVDKKNERLVHGNINSVISDNVKEVLPGAFYNSNIKKIRIPKKVETLSANAFYDSSLVRIDYDGTKNEFLQIINRKPLQSTSSKEIKIICSDGQLTSNGTSIS